MSDKSEAQLNLLIAHQVAVLILAKKAFGIVAKVLSEGDPQKLEQIKRDAAEEMVLNLESSPHFEIMGEEQALAAKATATQLLVSSITSIKLPNS